MIVEARIKHEKSLSPMVSLEPSNRELGALGENIAAQALQAHGYTVLEHNWTWIGGEADLIADHDGCKVIVEVKLRRSNSYGSPEDGVTNSKRKHLLQTGLRYMSELEQLDQCWQIDIVAIEMTSDGKVHRLTIYQDAVRADD